MTEFFIIIKEIILPIFMIIMLGFAMQKKFALHVQTLAKINIYLLVPGFIFVKLYRTEISVQLFANILLFFILYCVILFIIAQLVGKLIGLRKGKKTTFTNSVMFFNSGNYRSEEHTSELQSRGHLVCRLLLEKKNIYRH